MNQTETTQVFSCSDVELAAGAIRWPGRPGAVLTPDETKAYVEFDICYAWPVRTAYGGAFHPGTLANSYATMLHQVFNRSHEMRAYAPRDQRGSARDRVFGAIVGVEFPESPPGGWRINSPGAPHIHAAAVIHKNADGVPEVLGEHLSGRHRWAVSQEVLFQLNDSGFVIEGGDLPDEARRLAEAETPAEFAEAGLLYVPIVLSDGRSCPEDLMDCYSREKRRIVSDWHGARVTLLKGGINGRVHFQGVGMVRYGAEREAQIQQILARDDEARFPVALVAALKKISDESQKIVDIVGGGVSTTLRQAKGET